MKKIARLAHLTPTPKEEGEGRNLFHRLGVECPGSGMTSEDAPGRVFLVNRTLLPSYLYNQEDYQR